MKRFRAGLFYDIYHHFSLYIFIYYTTIQIIYQFKTTPFTNHMLYLNRPSTNFRVDSLPTSPKTPNSDPGVYHSRNLTFHTGLRSEMHHCQTLSNLRYRRYTKETHIKAFRNDSY
jgi:hypothetical protein